MKRFPFLALSVAILLIFGVGSLRGDTLCLKNGRVVNGIIKAEDEQKVRMEFEYGTIEFRKSDIERIQRTTADQSDGMRAKWAREKMGEESKYRPGGDVFAVDALLNDSVRAILLLDTGASSVVLSRQIGVKLGLLADGYRIVDLRLGDGRRVRAAAVTLKNVKVKGAEASDVAARVLLDDTESALPWDGALGMSFLNRFNFKVDHQNRKLILERFK